MPLSGQNMFGVNAIGNSYINLYQTLKIKNNDSSIIFHNPNQEGFEAIIKHLHSKNYKFISIEELYSRLEKE